MITQEELIKRISKLEQEQEKLKSWVSTLNDWLLTLDERIENVEK